MTTLKRTPIFPEYEKFSAKTIDFGGWELPVQFSSIIHEHELTRTKATIFDVSHMGEITVSGEDSLPFLQRMVTNDVSLLSPNKAQYSFMCNEQGGTVDDFLIYMIDKNEYFLVVNAANIEKDLEWLQKHKHVNEKVTITNESEHYALVAVQGPKAETILQQITDEDLSQIKPFTFRNDVQLKGVTKGVLLSRTGYTGEDGFEIYIHAIDARNVWNIILETGKEQGLEPAGLGARDTLRFEAGLPLYSQELSETISPIEAGLQFAVKLNKNSDFIGKNALEQQVNTGPSRKLVGIEMIDKGIPRTGYTVFSTQDEEIGVVTSGTQSPTLKKNIGFVLIDEKYSEIDTELWIQVRKRKLRAKIIKTPFYRR